MFKRLGICAALCLLAFTNAISAQPDEPDTFPIEQRCIDAPTQPPDDWTYPGMILMSGYAGIHAMQADWETPRVVAQFTSDSDGNFVIDGGQLSPDENWYATPIGEVTSEASFNNYWYVHGLRLYNLFDASKSFTVNLADYAEIYTFYETAWTFYPVEWQDNESLIIGGLLIYPFEDSAEASRLEFGDDFNLPRVVSPDGTRAYGGPTPFFSEYRAGLHDLVNLTTIASPGELNNISWRRDSAGFMAQMLDLDQDWHGLIYIDREGNVLDRIVSFDANSWRSDHPVSGRNEFWWSPNDRYFALVPVQSRELKNLYLVDLHERTVIDTCLKALSPAVWSPDGKMFAYLVEARENLNLVVVDTMAWQSYIVARHSGERARGRFGEPEMVGWRSTENDQ